MKKVIALLSVCMLFTSLFGFAAYGGGGGSGGSSGGSSGTSSMKKDSCPGGLDLSGSQYDGKCTSDLKLISLPDTEPRTRCPEGEEWYLDILDDSNSKCVPKIRLVLSTEVKVNIQLDLSSIPTKGGNVDLQGTFITDVANAVKISPSRVSLNSIEFGGTKGHSYDVHIPVGGGFSPGSSLQGSSASKYILTNRSRGDAVLSLIAPPVAAAETEYFTFTITIPEDIEAGSSLNVTVPVTESGIDQSMITTETVAPTPTDDATHNGAEDISGNGSLSDLFRSRNDTTDVSPLAGDSAGEDLFDLPAVLPRTGASL